MTDMSTRELTLPRDRRLTVEDSDTQSTLRLLAPNGEVELTVEIGPNGPTVRLRAINLEITAERDIALAAARIAVTATEHLSITSGGDVELSSRQGNICLRANDDVSVDAERIRLNSPSSTPAVTWEQFLERVGHDET